jgi:hypothetical protein
MSLFASLNISVEKTAICVVDRNGQVLLEMDRSADVIAEKLRDCNPTHRVYRSGDRILIAVDISRPREYGLGS